jgi:hypothetical protein
MSSVYVIGAGASYGEILKRLPDVPSGPPGSHPLANLNPHAPPMTRGFFDSRLLDVLMEPGDKRGLEQEFKQVITHIRDAKLIDGAFGQGAWKELDLEEIFTSIEVEREFQNPETDRGAELLLVRNGLIRYVRRVIGLCTRYSCGEYYGILSKRMHGNDSIVTFNWDLLLDHEFVQPMTYRVMGQYSKFFATVKPTDLSLHEMSFSFPGEGLFLKLHGSLNWYRCGNRRCPAATDFTFSPDTQKCLSVCTGIADVPCQQCGSEMNPIIVPPVLRKSIADDPVIRSAWGLARRKLMEASRVVVVGFSAAPTDFYASWLLRSTVGVRNHVRIDVINPSNGPHAKDHQEFRERMLSIFPKDYDFSRCHFSEIGSILPA